MVANIYPRPSSLEEIWPSGSMDFEIDNATGTRIALCDYEHLVESLQFLLGDVIVFNGYSLRVGQDQWPDIPALRCQSVNARPFGRMYDSTWNQGPAFAKWKLDIAYAPNDYEEEDDEKPEDREFVKQSLDYSVEILSVPIKTSSGNAATRNIRLPLIEYSMTIPQILVPKWSAIQTHVGKINSGAFAGGAAGTVLFDGPSVNRTLSLFNRAWEVNYKFIYNRHGWNNTLNPKTLVWEPASDVGGNANDPYESADFDDLF